jgi:hypothetical protein
MVEWYGLQATIDPVAISRGDWNPRRSLDMARLRGEVLSGDEVRGRLLLAAPLGLVFDALADEEGRVDPYAVDDLLSPDNTSATS